MQAVTAADHIAERMTTEARNFGEVLTRMNESIYAAAIFVDRTGAFSPGDDRLHLDFGDMIIGTYQDPIDPGISAEGMVGFGYYPALGSSAGTFKIGRGESATTYFWQGAIDDVRVYNKALSQEELLWVAGQKTAVAKPF